MKKRSEAGDVAPSLRDKIIGLGDRSIRKSYYPQLLRQLQETERNRSSLAESEARYRRLSEELEQRVADRTSELEAANRELEAFSYSVSHDLRAPLRAIDGYSGILQEDFGDKLDAEGKRLLNAVRDNTRRMGQLIDDILKFSRAGRTEIAAADVDMAKLVREAIEDLAPDAGRARIDVGPLPHARGDPAMLRQVVVNLLSNAVKFSRPREAPAIAVSGSTEGDEAVYSVTDNGVGFDGKYVDRLYGVFQRLHTEAQFEGTGIGLAIVKRIVNRHGGRTWAEGRIDGGAAFHFSLPHAGEKHD